MPIRKRSAVAVAALLLVGACGNEERAAVTTPPGTAPTTTTAPAATLPAADTTTVTSDTTHYVPDDFATIQQAVSAARPGDLILVKPGTYREAVNVTTDNLTIRGLDRNEVVLDGELQLDNGIRVLGAKGVAIENMTAMNYTRNGFFWTGTDGYRGSYLTTYRTGDYGVYAFDAINGQLDHIYAAGSKDAGVYIGECYPCNAVVIDTLSEHNGLGYSGTNAGGNLIITSSTFRFNRAGVVPNSGSYELCYPQRETTIVGNVVHSNNQADTPAIGDALLAMGNGIVVAGGVWNTIERNLVYDHDRVGIALVPYLEEDPNDSAPPREEWTTTCEQSKQQAPVDPGGPVLWDSFENRVVGNVLEDNRQADLVVASVTTDESTLGNCLAGNTFTTSAPRQLEVLAPCDGAGSGDWKDGEYDILSWLTASPPPSVDWQTAPLPQLQLQENMPEAASAPARPATDVPMEIDLTAIQVPAKPA